MAELIDAAEATEEIVEEFVESLRMISTRAAVASASLTALAGAAVGFFAAYKRLDKKFADRAEHEIDEMRDHFRKQMIAREEKPDLSDLGKKVADLGYTTEAERDHIENAGERKDQAHVRAVVEGPGEPNTPAVPETVRNVFADNPPPDDAWDREAELANRTSDAPFVIHVDEMGELEYERVTLTYYAADDVLCDEQDKVVDDQEMVVGVENLDKFGHGSNDVNIVYVRNIPLTIDIEVVKSENSYAEEVHGIKHADSPPRRRRERPTD